MLPFWLEEQNGDFREEMERNRVCEDQGGARAGGSANQGRVRGFAGVQSRRRLNNFPRARY